MIIPVIGFYGAWNVLLESTLQMIKLKLVSVKGKLLGLDTKKGNVFSQLFSISNSKQNSDKIGNPKDQFHSKAVCKNVLVL